MGRTLSQGALSPNGEVRFAIALDGGTPEAPAQIMKDAEMGAVATIALPAQPGAPSLASGSYALTITDVNGHAFSVNLAADKSS